MKPFLVNRYGRIVFPDSYFPALDFSVFESLEQFAAAIRRDFEDKAPNEADIAARLETGAYKGRYELLRDLALDLFWVNRYSLPLYDKRPTRWRDVPRNRSDVFLPVLTPWQDGDRKVAAVEKAYRELPASFDAATEDRIFGLLFDVFGHRRHHATELPAVKPTVAELLEKPGALTFVLPEHDPDYPVFGTAAILDAHADVFADADPTTYLPDGPRVPGHIIQGRDDITVPPMSQRTFVAIANATGHDITLEELDGVDHEDITDRRVVARALDWLAERL